MGFGSAFALLLGLAMLAAPAVAQTKPATQADAPDWAERGPTPRVKASAAGVSVARGREVFAAQCATCHGFKGRGDGPRSSLFPPEQYIPDLTAPGFLAGRDGELLRSIREGLRRLDEPLVVMPQFKYILGEADMRSVLAYVKTLPAQRVAKKTPRRE